MSIELDNIASGYNLSLINSNFQKIEDVINSDILWKNGTLAGETLMTRDLDMNGNAILNTGVNLEEPDSLLTLEVADERYYNVSGDTLEGILDAGQNRLTNLAAPINSFDASRKIELDSEVAARQGADANIQSQLTGNIPLEASAFSEISWHGQQIENSVTIPSNRNAWSFGPQMEISEGQAVTISPGSSWTIANGRVVEDEDLHSLIADSITTPDASVTVQVDEIVISSELATTNSDVSDLEVRMTAEEGKIQPIAKGGTGAITGAAALVALGATGRLLNTQIFNTAGSFTYTPTAGTTSIVVDVIGGGGSGGGAPIIVSGTNRSAGSGGGAGGYARSRLTSGFSGATVVVGAGGVGVAAANGGAGGASSFAGTIIGGGGAGGEVGAAPSTSAISAYVAGGAGSGGNIINSAGGLGERGFVLSATVSSSGGGGVSVLYPGGAGGRGSLGAGAASTSPGCAGAGANGTTTTTAGGNGSPGIVIIYEFS